VYVGEGQERILLTILFNYVQEEFNLVESEYECIFIYIEKKERTSSNCSSGPRLYTRSVCVSVCVINCIRLLICAGDRIRQQAFPAYKPIS
jgi:hypothetical protein